MFCFFKISFLPLFLTSRKLFQSLLALWTNKFIREKHVRLMCDTTLIVCLLTRVSFLDQFDPLLFSVSFFLWSKPEAGLLSVAEKSQFPLSARTIWLFHVFSKNYIFLSWTLSHVFLRRQIFKCADFALRFSFIPDTSLWGLIQVKLIQRRGWTWFHWRTGAG